MFTTPSNLLTSASFDFLEQLCKVLLCGDFNAYRGMWGSQYANCIGRVVVGAIDVHDLFVATTPIA